MKWLIQSTGFSTVTAIESFEVLKHLGYDVYDFGILNDGVSNLENIIEPNDKYIIRGGTRLMNILNNIQSLDEINDLVTKEQIECKECIDNLRKGIDYDVDKFDQALYSQLDLPLLNNKNNSHYTTFEEAKDVSYGKDMFIKPSRDLKTFDGGILPARTTIEQYIKTSKHQLYYKDETIIINDLIPIKAEYRFFMIKDQIIGMSQYRRHNKTSIQPFVPEIVQEAALEYSKLYQPNDVYVMDLAETGRGIKIVEYNCWNASGLYRVDINNVFGSINEFKSVT